MKNIMTATVIALSTATLAQADGTELFQQLDANNDQAISLEEAQASEALVAQFEQLDANKDGLINAAEFTQLVKG
ncbi:EF-hand domain-containing protein [Neptunomonas marina]|nr:EF-hand domain-containing protein [Neptunomonas marina]